MPAKRVTRAPATRTYILDMENGDKKEVTVPANWKLTFGMLVPRVGGHGNGHGVALRFYEGNKENLRAVMVGVTSLRDKSMGVVEISNPMNQAAAQILTMAVPLQLPPQLPSHIFPETDEDAQCAT